MSERPQSEGGAWRVAIDAMGGDEGVAATVPAAAELSLEGRLHLMLVGDARAIDGALGELVHNPEYLSVAHTREEATGAASIERAMEQLGKGRVDAMVTAGHPGVALEAASRHVPMIRGMERAALGAVVPTVRVRGERHDPFCLVLDVGAALHADADALVAFGLVGAAYAQVISANERPRVGLLAASRKPWRGPAGLAAAHPRLEALAETRGFDYIGPIEGHRLPAGDADVVVCEGFTGNIVIRLLEGIADSAVELAREAADRKMTWRFALSLLSEGLTQLRRLTDWEQYGGAPLLGFARPIMITHAHSGVRAMRNAIKLAARGCEEDVVGQIERHLHAHLSARAEDEDAAARDAPPAELRATEEDGAAPPEGAGAGTPTQDGLE